MTLSIIIISYNTQQLTVNAVQAAWKDAQASEVLKGKTEIIIIDNNSKDDSVKALKEVFDSPRITIIANRENVGFAKANNQGISKAQGKFILLLNSDTLVQKGALEMLVTTMDKFSPDTSSATLESNRGEVDRLGILAATLLNEDGTIQPQGGSFPSLASLFFHMTMLDDLPLIGKLLPSTQHTGLRQVEKLEYSLEGTRLMQRDWVGGTAVLVRREVFNEIGTLEDSIFMYGEDIELCMRAKHHHWDIAIHPVAKVTHIGNASGSSAKAIIGELKGYQYIWSKHKPLWQQRFARWLLRWGSLQRVFIFGTIARDSNKKKAYQQALEQL
jgi:GT2 family glycosyltransferase